MPSAALYPIFLNLARRHVLVVGGGAVGARKAQGLLAAGARVTVVSPAFNEAFERLKPVTLIEAKYTASHMRRRKWSLAFTAANIAAVNRQAQKDAAAAGVLCCRCDDPGRGDFNNGATASVGPVMLSVSTGGAAPGLSARIRESAAKAIDPCHAALAELHHAWRPLIKKKIRTPEQRRLILQRMASEEMIVRFRRRGRAGAEKLLQQWLKEITAPDSSGSGTPGRRRG
ncbi:MAG: precorrin-2 dehydrogenase/sirohydrochlorin ferrochelatase family protein [Phycisphaerae bacterium]